jgi:hypothetical protein
MKRRIFLRDIARAAHISGLRWELERRGANHDVYSLDGLIIPIPRHNELDEYTAQKIFKECEPKLGSRWWR